MVQEKQTPVERYEGRKRSRVLWVVGVLLVGIGIGYALRAIQDWLFA